MLPAGFCQAWTGHYTIGVGPGDVRVEASGDRVQD